MQIKITTVVIKCQQASGKLNVMAKLLSQHDRRVEVSDAAWRVIVRESTLR